MVTLDLSVEYEPELSGGEGREKRSKQKKQGVHKRVDFGGEGGWREIVTVVT